MKMKWMCERMVATLIVMLCMAMFVPAIAYAQSGGVVLWNKMESDNGSSLISEVGPDLSLSGTNWSYRPAMFNDGWDNNSESSYAYANSSDLISSCREGAFAFWWVPDDDGDTTLGGCSNCPLNKASVFFSNGATNYPPNDLYQFEFWYAHWTTPPSIQVFFNKRSTTGTNHIVRMYSASHAYTGEWEAGDRVHMAFAWHNEPVILGEYIAALWIDGELAYGWTEPDEGTLEGWRDTNPTQPFSNTLRIGDSIFPYSTDEQLRGPIDNIIFWNYAKEDFSDRFDESPLIEPVAFDIKPGSCPNPLNLRSRGVIPAAVLGTASLDVEQIDTASLRLEGVAPIRSSLEDVAMPVWPFTGKEDCMLDCDDAGPDGFIDLTLKFKTQQIVEALGDIEEGYCRVMTLTGNLKEEFGGTKIVGEDVVIIKLRGGGGLRLGEPRIGIRKSRTIDDDENQAAEDLQLRR